MSSTIGVTLKLEPGEYELEEVEAPEGYIITSGPWHFTVEEDGNLTGDAGVVNGSALTITISNEPGAELPAAGGTGPMLIKILGATLISAAIFTYVLCGKRQYAYARANNGRRSTRRGTPRRDSRR